MTSLVTLAIACIPDYIGESHRNRLNLITASYFINNLDNTITGLLQLLGYLVSKSTISILSETGIATLLRFSFWIFSFTILIRRISKNKFQAE